MVDLLFLIHLASSWAMTGIVWFVQIVHYPLFNAVGRERFETYENMHTRQTGIVVAPLMGIEALTALVLVVATPAGVSFFLAAVDLLLVGAIWASTFFVQVPLHQRLSAGFDGDAHRRLVGSNWLRTGLWSVRAFLLLWMAAGWRHGAP